jgi:hypothetical protein
MKTVLQRLHYINHCLPEYKQINASNTEVTLLHKCNTNSFGIEYRYLVVKLYTL